MAQQRQRHTGMRSLLVGILLSGLVPALLVLCPPPGEAADTTYRNQMRTARRFVSRDQPQEAIKILEVVFRKHPYEPKAASLYVDALLQLDRYQKAEGYLEEAMAQSDVVPMGLYRSRVNVYLAMEKWNKALADVVQTMILGEGLTDWSFKTSRGLIEKGLDPGDARKIVGTALVEAPGHADLILLNAIMAVLDGEPQEALVQVTQVDRKEKDEGRILLNYSDHLVTLGYRTEAKQAIEAAAKEAVKLSRRSQVLFRLSDLLQEDGDFEEALVQLALIAVEREGSSAGTKALIESAAIYRENLNDCVRALNVYERLEGDPAVGHHLPELLLQKAECQVHIEDFENAMITYDAVFPEALDPEHAERAAYGKASVMFFAGQPDSALTLFQDMAEAYPRSLQTDDAAQRYILLNAYAALGGGEAMTMMGRMEWAIAVGDSAAIVAAADDLIQAYPRSEPAAEAWMVLGALAESNALYTQALGCYEKIVQDHSHDRRAPLALKKQGDLLVEHLNKPEKALEKLERILTGYSNSIVAGEARRLVEKIRSAIKS